jgi:hypothetical protein
MTRRSFPRRRVFALLAPLALAAVGLAGVGIAGAARHRPAPVPVEREVQSEIDAMIASGAPAHDPKVELLRDQLAELRRGSHTTPPKEPGVDLGQLVADALAAEADAARAHVAQDQASSPATAQTTRWQSGTVVCEPVPQLLTVQEIAGATCLSVPQPDGSSRYVAVTPTGVVRTVEFGNDGEVQRRPDRKLPVPREPGSTTLTPTPSGDLRVATPGRPAVTVDLG